MEFLHKFLPLLVASAILTLFILLVRRHYHREIPGWLALTELLLLIFIPAFMVIPFSLRYSVFFDSIFNFSLAFFLFSWPIVIAAPDISASLATLIYGSLYDSSLVTPAPSSYGRARACVMEDDLDGAALEYRKYFQENPSVPAPLFALAQLYERQLAYGASAYCYREIMSRFHKNKFVWSEAGLRLGDLYMHQMNNPASATQVFQEIVRRVPDLEQGRQAGNRINHVISLDHPSTERPLPD